MSTVNALSKVARNAQEPLRDQILQRCRTALMSGRFAPGQKLPLRPLAKEFDTSLMPVRDALNRLVADGALELSANRTIRVPSMPDERLIELHEIRMSLEGLATERATPNLTTSAIDRTEQLIDVMTEALQNKDYDRYIQSHYSFHFTIYAAAGRPTLLGIIEILWLQVGPWFRQGIERGNIVLRDPNENHRRLAAALRTRDAPLARKTMEQDISIGTEFLRTGVLT